MAKPGLATRPGGDRQHGALLSPAIPAQELNVVTSAAGAGAGHVVKITSKASADSPIARRRDQTEIENGLIASGLGYTLLRRVILQGLPAASGAPGGSVSRVAAAGGPPRREEASATRHAVLCG